MAGTAQDPKGQVNRAEDQTAPKTPPSSRAWLSSCSLPFHDLHTGFVPLDVHSLFPNFVPLFLSLLAKWDQDQTGG